MPNGFTVNTHRRDPYKNFKFKVRNQDGAAVLGVSKVSSLKRTTEVVRHRDGNQNSHDSPSPGRSSYEGITMERGVTHDPEFERWANLVHPYAGDAAMDLQNYKQELSLEVMNEKGHVALRYFLHGCWVSEFTAMPDLDANANAIAIESIKIELEGWERDQGTTEPDEGSAGPAG